MASEMTAFIEYDRTPDGWQGPESDLPSPFSEATGEPYSVTVGDGGIYTGSKDYVFFAAIAGIRNETGIPPLFPPRGLPPNPSREVRKNVAAHGDLMDNERVSWLRLSEIQASLDHHRIDRNLLHFEAVTILAIMENLASRLGNDRVRLVFGFNG